MYMLMKIVIFRGIILISCRQYYYILVHIPVLALLIHNFVYFWSHITVNPKKSLVQKPLFLFIPVTLDFKARPGSAKLLFFNDL